MQFISFPEQKKKRDVMQDIFAARVRVCEYPSKYVPQLSIIEFYLGCVAGGKIVQHAEKHAQIGL